MTPVRHGAANNNKPALPQFARGTKLVQLAQQKNAASSSSDSDYYLDIEHSAEGKRDENGSSSYSILRTEEGSSVPLSSVFVVEGSEVRHISYN
jgi:hypothetical protein